MAFEFTPSMVKTANMLWAVSSAVGAGLCFLALLVIGAIYSHPKARKALDRVSFRIVCYALLANMVFGISNAVGGTMDTPEKAAGFGCGFTIFILQLSLQLSSWLLFSIALNLVLVIIYRVNGQRMEKFYVIGSCAISLMISIPPYASGQYGWDAVEEDCFYSNDDRQQRLAWQIGTQMAWTGMTIIGEVVCSLFVIVFLLKHQRRINGVFNVTNTASDIGTDTLTGKTPQVIVANTYLNIVLRIALYPATSCVVNILSVFTSLYSTATKGIHNEENYRILLLSDFIYGGRAISYAILALFDPAVVKGMHVLYSHFRYGPNAERVSSDNRVKTCTGNDRTRNNERLQVHIELSTIQDYGSVYQQGVPQKATSAETDMESSHHALDISRDANDKSMNQDVGTSDSYIPFGLERLERSDSNARPGGLARRLSNYEDLRKEEEDTFRRNI